MDELLLPQRLLVQKKNSQNQDSGTKIKGGSSSSVMKFRNKIPSNKMKTLNLLEKAELGQKYIQNYSDEKFHTEIIPRISLTNLILDQKLCLEELLPSLELVSLAMTCKGLYSYFKSLRYHCVIKLHHVANIIRSNQGFGIFDGCNITIGDGDEIVNADDLQLMCSALQSPRTQISCELLGFAVQLNSTISEGLILDFIRAFKYPSIIPLRSLSLEGSLIGESGMVTLGNILKKNYLPNLVTLNLNRNRGRYRGIHCLQQSLLISPTPSPLLEHLSLSDNHGEISVLEFLCSDVLRTRPRLISLDISHNSLSLNESESINLLQRRKSLNLYTLQSLDLSFNPLSDEYFYSFLQLMWPLSSFSSLERQLSRHGSLGSPGRQKSPKLKMKQRIHLKELTINHSLIGNKSFSYLGSLLNEGRFSQIRRLSLGMNSATGRDGIEGILTALLPYQYEVNEMTAREDLEEEGDGGGRGGGERNNEENDDEKDGERLNHEDGMKRESARVGDEDDGEIMDWRKGFKILSISMNPLSNEGLLAIMTAGTAGAFQYLEELDISDLGASSETVLLFLRNFISYGKYDHLKKLIVFGRQPFAGKNARGYCTTEFLQRVKVS